MSSLEPIPSNIEGVKFGLLSSKQIKAQSVKRIENSLTFDNLLHPVPGGLYDPALGALDNYHCTTCNLARFSCPGHFGHIELAVPVYHTTFIAQLVKLLRSKCAYCHHFKMAKVNTHAYVCKLRLLDHGLLAEAAALDDHDNWVRQKSLGAESDSSSEDDAEKDRRTLMGKRERYVNKKIREAQTKGSLAEGHMLINDARRALIKQLLLDLPKNVKCANCGGISLSFRADKSSKIFQKRPNKTTAQKIAADGKVMKSALLELRKYEAKQNHIDDEGVIMEDSPTEESQEAAEEIGDLSVGSDIFYPAHEAKAAMTLLFEKESHLLSVLYGKDSGAEKFFIDTIAVPPNKFRPETRRGPGQIEDAVRNKLFKNILDSNAAVRDIRREIAEGRVSEIFRRQRHMGDLNEAWVRLQDHVNALIDKNQNPLQGAAAKGAADGVKQILEKKEGLFRKNMMGKRVNFAARSVISPDPNIETNEIGVPPVFAKKLTYPEPVTEFNVEKLRQAVINGPEKWPGASLIENENGQIINLKGKSLEQKQALAYSLLTPPVSGTAGSRNKKVHRHLHNGDIVLMNRQPTLHKPSIMAHRTRVLPGEKTIRMHYVNCNTYNADFDGDEMNMHLPQNELARAEAFHIAETDQQYLSATAGKPLRGLIQDHISVGVSFTSRDTFFTREQYHQLLYNCLRPEDKHTTSDRIHTFPPSILKPQPLWTGKQVITTILENIRPLQCPGITFKSKSATDGDRWGLNSEEGTVIFKDGEFVSGILDKKQFGAADSGLVHSVYEAYGPSSASKLLSALGRLLTKYLNVRAFSCGIEDLVLTPEGNARRRERISKASDAGLQATLKYVGLEDKPISPDSREFKTSLESVLRDQKKQSGYDTIMMKHAAEITSDVIGSTLPSGLMKPFPWNHMQVMTGSGAKGSDVNASQISCLLGQQSLEGRRVPVMVSGKSLPSFKPFESNPRAGGHIVDRFLTGVRPQEYFFHCMAGREGLIDTAVKTSRSGYLQRVLVKGLESLKVQYDDTVRDSDGSLVQFLYGEDGLDVAKQKHLNQFKFIIDNKGSYARQLSLGRNKELDLDAASYSKKAIKSFQKKGIREAMDPALARYSPSSNTGSTSEAFYKSLKEYIETNPDRVIRDKSKGISGIGKKDFEALMYAKYRASVVEPGEAIGIVAAQSVGEPSTQMTLNTFHLAGHAAKNVTLGIPRLREIVMTASDHISTPNMTLHLIPELTDDACEKFAKGISRLSLAQIIDEVKVDERVEHGIGYATAKVFRIKLKFFSGEDYASEHGITIDGVAAALERKFVPALERNIKHELKKAGSKASSQEGALPEIGESVGQIEQYSGEVDDEASDDGDASEEKRKRNQTEQTSYEAPDEDEAEIAEQQRRDESPDEDIDIGDEGLDMNLKMKDLQLKEAASRVEDLDLERLSLTADAKEREERVRAKNDHVQRFAFDDKHGQLCEIRLEYAADIAKILMLNLVEKTLKTVLIQSVPNLGNCVVEKESSSNNKKTQQTTRVVYTEGVNLVAIREFTDFINPNKVFTNDIAAMLRTYGVEACRNTIVREIGAVFSGHNIDVDRRHLQLIADVMTQGGGFVPFSRYGMARSTSPLLKMSFETTVGYLRDAALEGDIDRLQTPSARLVVGRLGKVGTGSFDVLMDPLAGM